MKQNVFILSVVLVLIISACAPQATPTLNPQDVQHTAEAAALTMVAQTQGAMPTDTAVPPTATATATLEATATPIESPTIDPSLAASTGLPTVEFAATIGATSLPPTAIPPAASTDANCNKALTGWKGPTANFSIVNETQPKGKIILSLYVVTPLGECGYLADLSQGPAGQYSAGAFVDGKKSFKVFGNFRITEGSWKITVRNDKIIANGSCYPNC